MNRAQVLALLVLMLFGRLAGADERRPAEAGPPDWARVSRLQIAAARELGVPVAIENDMGMRFVLIPAGTFRMGSAAFEPGSPLGFDNPQHTVELTEPFYLQITEVTNAQYRRFQPGHNSGSVSGGSLNGDNQPVVRVSWMDALKFAHWLSARDGARRYEVPSEARWEYACRAGRSALCSTSDAITAEVANVDGRPDHVFRGRSVDVASFAPSAWGLYDMDGNVLEYCSSWYSTYPRSSVVVDPLGALHPTQGRAVRGGAWDTTAVTCSLRGYTDPRYLSHGIGVRLVCALPSANAPEVRYPGTVDATTSGIVRWTRPHGWVQLEPRAGREVTFRIGENAECWVSVLETHAGGAQAYFSAWEKQLGFPDWRQDVFECGALVDVLGHEAVAFKLVGPYQDDTHHHARATLLGLVVVRSDDMVTVARLGPFSEDSGVHEKESQEFLTFCRSLRAK